MTLGNSPVRFNKRMAHGYNIPVCAHSKIPLPGNTNPLNLDLTDEGHKRIPKKTKIEPLHKPSEDLLRIESENKKFDQL